MANKQLITFINKARARGFLDEDIIKPLVDEGWSNDEIDEAFTSLRDRAPASSTLTIALDKNVMVALKKRARRNLLTPEQQVQDIVRRSMANARKSTRSEKLDDLLVAIFSRKAK